jgi:hypothetical protein
MTPIACALASHTLAHVSRYALESVERAMLQTGMPGRRTPIRGQTMQRAARYLYRAGVARRLLPWPRSAVLVPMMGLQESLLFPWALNHEVVPVIFDCMPHEFAQWQRLFQRLRIRTAFFTASAAAAHFNQVLPAGRWRWLPEAINLVDYSAAQPWATRPTQVLEFGRRYGKYHEVIALGLANASVRHVYEQRKGELVFATQADFLAGLGQAQISICFPQSMTHPERFGTVETLTQRYLESMASGCVLLGSAPGELIDLCGYNPVIDVDWTAPVAQLMALRAEPQQHAELRARNLDSVRRLGAWDVRAQQATASLSEAGYSNGDQRLAGTQVTYLPKRRDQNNSIEYHDQ